ncbi:Acetoacetate decarboxylase (ADC) [Micromonospora pattaloongensis]|uniref:Acetoacetate decarboxylase (ADC) n=1 Tax=Micromonospora pattaloongensis TaxID=405436 RepID=A0A1H3RW25_9ACTN|nr:acetoacetate decarboxylase family protein [Micromonospora pattaloongensis]SDZ29862.1 Acetoacetate decarboxylase (ADC) [Micromonospora pattaloongensis]
MLAVAVGTPAQRESRAADPADGLIACAVARAVGVTPYCRAMTVSYPPEPWHLRGRMYLSVWLVPAARLPALPPRLVERARPILIGGRAVVGTAWVRYEPGGVLHYHELLSAVLVRVGVRPRVSILDIWVDSDASRAGGRELWGIPKERAAFEFPESLPTSVAATAADGAPLASAEISTRWRLPGRWPFAFSVTQARKDRVLTTPVRGDAVLHGGAVRWRPDPGGPLGYLADRRPWLTLAVTDFRLLFGHSWSLTGERLDTPTTSQPSRQRSRFP